MFKRLLELFASGLLLTFMLPLSGVRMNFESFQVVIHVLKLAPQVRNFGVPLSDSIMLLVFDQGQYLVSASLKSCFPWARIHRVHRVLRLHGMEGGRGCHGRLGRSASNAVL